ncbi:MAG: hypothetical protein JJ978_14850 [Roseivirga sp.]|jgi:hypothetical protein|uniref:hypothetical protein n=1 Tax=Roseivirga sp. TaxID=1964215 RepID=UPI001B2B6F90|nr:hypothetical protein [Roseivirga sp.]MBO6496846.1 hypothetical protein [Roseivirga sp.]
MSLTRDIIKIQVVKPALESVGDFDGDFEEFSFNNFQPTYQSVFLEKIKTNIQSIPVTDGDTTYNQYMYDVILNPTIFSGWTIVKDCIDYVSTNYSTGPR